MRIWPLPALAALLLAGCAGSEPPSGGGTFGSVVGTPFLIALKIPTCAATVALAGPIIAASSLARPEPDDPFGDARKIFRADEGLSQNCGPPYAVAP